MPVAMWRIFSCCILALGNAIVSPSHIDPGFPHGGIRECVFRSSCILRRAMDCGASTESQNTLFSEITMLAKSVVLAWRALLSSGLVNIMVSPIKLYLYLIL